MTSTIIVKTAEKEKNDLTLENKAWYNNSIDQQRSINPK